MMGQRVREQKKGKNEGWEDIRYNKNREGNKG
jgi:hypothetical protein